MTPTKATTTPPPVAVAPPPPKPQKNAPAVKPSTHFQTLEAPAAPISGDKQQRLAALLQQYKADQLTPEQYHTQRAKILAEP
jgi:hypothetical protein